MIRQLKIWETLWSILVLLMSANATYAQYRDVIPPSPNASALAKYVDNPVSLFTGTPQIGIPIYTIELKDFQLPISLSYNPQEIKVGTTASEVGLGWALNAGGVITRVVKHYPDDYRQDVCNTLEEYDLSMDFPSPLLRFPYCPWGYMYAISEGESLIIDEADDGSPIGYTGTSTYDLDLDAIYANRSNITPERAILMNFGVPQWGVWLSDGWEWDDDLHNYSLRNVRQFNGVKMIVDLEPDIFYFNFNGYTGKFVFDVEDGTPKIRTIPYQNLDITYRTDENSGRLIGFTVIDPNGVEYIFEDIEHTINWENVNDPSRMRRMTYNSSWWLTRINSPSKEYLSFNYVDQEIIESDLFYSSEPDVIAEVNGLKPWAGDFSDLNRNHRVSGRINSTKRIESIEGSNIKVGFGDHVSRSINSITIESKSYGSSLSRLKKFELTYDYFICNTENLPDLNGSSHRVKRLRLKSIQEFGESDNNSLPAYTFEYNYYDYNGNNELKFPTNFSYNIDLWGYANGADNETIFPAMHIYPDHYEKGDSRMYSVYELSNYTGRHFTTVGGNRLPNNEYTDIGVLTKINYPTGGSSIYKYEGHKFEMFGEEFEGGGLRIKAIIKMESGTDDIIYKYKYLDDSGGSSGKVVGIPMFAELPRTAVLDHPELLEGYSSSPLWNFSLLRQSEENRYLLLPNYYAYPINQLGQTAGSYVGYTKVTEYLVKNFESDDQPIGKTEYYYSFPAAIGDENDQLNDDCTINENGICDGFYESTRIHNFFMYGNDRDDVELEYFPESSLSYMTPPNPNYDWARGLLLKRKVIDAVGNTTLVEEYDYSNYFPLDNSSPTEIYGFKLAQFYPYANFSEYVSEIYSFRVAKYSILTDAAKVLSSKRITEYKLGNANSYTKEVRYEHEGKYHSNITKIVEETSEGDELITTYKYAPDYSHPFGEPIHSDGGGYALRSRKISNVPVEESHYKKIDGEEYLLEAKLTTYVLEDDIPVKRMIYGFDTKELIDDFSPSHLLGPPGLFTKDVRYAEKVNMTKYDANGNILEMHNKITGITTSFIWGYRSEYPICKIVNATYDEISDVLDETTLRLLRAGFIVTPPTPNVEHIPLTDDEVRTMLEPLRSGLSHAQVYTYTYKPLVGMTSETTPDGRIIKYEYDSFNRLYQVKDQDGNVLKQYKYHYSNQ